MVFGSDTLRGKGGEFMFGRNRKKARASGLEHRLSTRLAEQNAGADDGANCSTYRDEDDYKDHKQVWC
jgi:hypothetical protein